MAGRRWSDLSERARRTILIGVVLESILKIAALVDLARRPASGIRGRKWAWATAVTVVNAFGAAPLAYFRLGRK